MKPIILYTLLAFAAIQADTAAAQNTATLTKAIDNYMTAYKRHGMDTGKPALGSCTVNDTTETITITGEKGFKEQVFTEATVDRIYSELKALLPAPYKKYTLKVLVDGHEIEYLVPNALRNGKKDRTRLWRTESQEQPWVCNLSRPFTPSAGLDGEHIALWQSHGRYWDANKGVWKWQRPRLFCTCEDLFTQTLVIPYIIPMLENAGAVVYTPRERDWQSNCVIVDNDTPRKDGSYTEFVNRKDNANHWYTLKGPGFANRKSILNATDQPFTHGTARAIHTVSSTKGAPYAQWTPNIPADGRYAVYVSYSTVEGAADDAVYRVHHKGGITEFAVNQTMGGGTWVYLGTFTFDKGQHDYGRVTLSSYSRNGKVITADAVRFGGGMGNVARGLAANYGGELSGMPRWAEAARYNMQFAGMRDTTYDYYETSDDYKSDILSRPRSINELAGGSNYLPGQTGRHVPFDLAVAFHSDAGFKTDDSFVGSLSICTTDKGDGTTPARLNRYAGYDLAALFLENLKTDLSKYNWTVRKLWNRNYGETRVPDIPSVILEMLSHQNFADMQLAYDPKFKFDLCRSIYKTIVKYEAEMHQRPYVIQPLPVKDFAVTLDEKKKQAILSWQPVDDASEPTARPTAYVVYTRTGYGDFDNGTVVHGTTYAAPLTKDQISSFRVCALNKGGQSFPSETLAACIASQNQGTVLIVNAFDRLSGPQAVNTTTRQGFDLDADPGVPYGAFAGFCGRQTGFDKSKMGSELSDGLGASGSELEGKIVMGNTFDYVFLHGKGIQLARHHSFASTSIGAFLDAHGKKRNTPLNVVNYRMVDVIGGVQTYLPPSLSTILSKYAQRGGRILVSGANMLKNENLLCPALKGEYASTLTDTSISGISGCGLQFDIYRAMNDKSYAVPRPETLKPVDGAFAMLTYANGQTAATAYDGKQYKTVVCGFPVESIDNGSKRNQLIGAIVRFLCK